MKFVGDRPLSNPEAAARRLLAIVLARDIDVGQFAYAGAVNDTFLQAGGDVAEYIAGRDFAVAHGWIKLDPSGSRIILLQPGADLA